jgi:hypothetical protein
MAFVVTTLATKERKTYSAWDKEASDLIFGDKTFQEKPRLLEIHYGDTGYSGVIEKEVFGRIKNIKIERFMDKKSTRIDCVDILPADLTLLRMFQDSIHAEVSNRKKNSQRFILKKGWYRFFNKEKEIKDPDLRKYLLPGKTVTIEYHMNFMSCLEHRSPSPNPIIRKIILN